VHFLSNRGGATSPVHGKTAQPIRLSDGLPDPPSTSGQTLNKPAFVFGSRFARWANLSLAGVFFLIAIGTLFLQPPAVGAFIVWGGFGVLYVYYWLKTRSSIVTSISFYDDRIEKSGASPNVYRYADIQSVYVSGITGWGKVTLKTGDSPLTLAQKPKSASAEEFYSWLGHKLEGSGEAVDLSAGGVRGGLSTTLGVLFVIPVAIIAILPIGLSLAFGTGSESSAGIVGAVAAITTFFFLAYRAAKKEDTRKATFYGKEIGPRVSWSVLRGRMLKKAVRWVPAILLLEVVGTVAVALLPFLPGESAYFLQTFQQARQTEGSTIASQFEAIFSNNIRVLLISFIPAWGPLSVAGSTYNTARVIEAITQNASYPLGKYFLDLFALPHTWLELTAYAVGVFEALSLPNSWGPSAGEAERRTLTSYVKEAAVVVTFAVGILAIAGAFEALEPRMTDPYLLWIPILIALGIGVYVWLRLGTPLSLDGKLSQVQPDH
jgi:Stage II sporulation protein M